MSAGSAWPESDWSPEELAVQRAISDQINAVLREVEAYDSPALLEDTAAQRKMDFLLAQHRECMGEVPYVQDGVLGGRDGSATHRSSLARWVSPRVTDSGLPKFDKYNPDHRVAPLIVLANNIFHEFMVRPPMTIGKMIGSFEVAPWTDCTWHNGAPDGPGSFLVQVRGQYVCVWWTCAACRRRIEARHPAGVRWHAPNSGTGTVMYRFSDA